MQILTLDIPFAFCNGRKCGRAAFFLSADIFLQKYGPCATIYYIALARTVGQADRRLYGRLYE